MARMRELGVMSTDFTMCNMSIRKMRVDDYVVTEREPTTVRWLPHRVKVEKRHPEERQQNHQACLTRPNPSHEGKHYARLFIAASSRPILVPIGQLLTKQVSLPNAARPNCTSRPAGAAQGARVLGKRVTSNWGQPEQT